MKDKSIDHLPRVDIKDVNEYCIPCVNPCKQNKKVKFIECVKRTLRGENEKA